MPSSWKVSVAVLSTKIFPDSVLCDVLAGCSANMSLVGEQEVRHVPVREDSGTGPVGAQRGDIASSGVLHVVVEQHPLVVFAVMMMISEL
jgi:hypothetical protein